MVTDGISAAILSASPTRKALSRLHPLALLFALSGTLMVSKTLRIPKF